MPILDTGWCMICKAFFMLMGVAIGSELSLGDLVTKMHLLSGTTTPVPILSKMWTLKLFQPRLGMVI